MTQLQKITCSILLLTSAVLAEDNSSNKQERSHSVREVVGKVGALEVKNMSIVDNFKRMFSEGKVSGRIRAMYGGYIQKKVSEPDTYALAVGGILKYELAEFNGFSGATAVYTSHDVSGLTGKNSKHNPDFSSSSGSYTEMAEAYLNYNYKDLNFRLGRQIIDTPLADSDDIRMIQNSFNAVIVTYELKGITFMAGNLQSWQGYDADLDNSWQAIGDKGANLVGASYHDGVEFNLWYYNITQNTNAIYLDFGIEYKINEDVFIHTVGQYLKENELETSGYAANIYGALFEFVIDDLAFSVAFDKSKKIAGKQSFSGSGGGTMFTSMDTMIIDEIANDRDVFAYVGGITYNMDNFGFLYAHGDFIGNANSAGKKARILEHDIGAEYNVNDEFLVSAIYVISEDKESSIKTSYDWNRVQIMVNYNF